ncbi:MAG TPA: carotenoid biosynthesis protein [bacterium]|nr:carotenoid biosynthesis protein [bacterium]
MNTAAEQRRPSLLRDLRDNGPIWFIYLMAISLLNYELTNVRPEHYAEVGIPLWRFAITAVFPLFWVIVYFYFRARDSQRLKNRWRTFGIVAGVLLGLPLLAVIGARPSYLTEQQIVMFYEYAQFLWVALLLAHVWYTRGFTAVALFFGVCFLYGICLENMGIIIGYFGESHYRHYLGLSPEFYLPAPAATMLGWCIVFYICIWLAEYLGDKLRFVRGRPLRLALLTTAIALSLDMQIDPLASLSGLWWKWDPRLPGFWLGVPFINYVAWAAAFLPFAFAYFYYKGREDLSPWRRNRRLLLWVPWMVLICLAIGMPIIILAERGISGPSFQIAFEFWDKIMPY